jgi:hypothetical protein
MSFSQGQGVRQAREDSHVMFKRFLGTLEHKTWSEALTLIDNEYRSFQNHHRRYFAKLILLSSYLRYPTKQMPKECQLLLLSIVDLPKPLAEKLAEPRPQLPRY